MKLLVCDVEGTIFEPHMIKDAEHASYIWTKIADELGDAAKAEEIQTQKKWRNAAYGFTGSGTAYINWVKASIRIHEKYGLTSEKFNQIINSAPYIPGVKEFFEKLNRTEYIPVLISGGIQNLNTKACIDLGIERENSFAACEYYFKLNEQIDWDLTFVNSCNFWGKEELVKILLRKYGLGRNDWIFIGDGVNDKSIAKKASVSIGINPVGGLEDIVDYSFTDFNVLIACKNLLDKTNVLIESKLYLDKASKIDRKNEMIENSAAKIKTKALAYVQKQIGNIQLKELKIDALNRINKLSHDKNAYQEIKEKITGVKELLETGQMTYFLYSEFANETHIAFSLLQSFCNAAEIMMWITFILMADDEKLQQFIQSQSKSEKGDYRSVYYWIDFIDIESLKSILKDYKDMRNPAAHTYQLISIEAAQSFILRTYENIQRMELIINPTEEL